MVALAILLGTLGVIAVWRVGDAQIAGLERREAGLDQPDQGARPLRLRRGQRATAHVVFARCFGDRVLLDCLVGVGTADEELQPVTLVGVTVSALSQKALRAKLAGWQSSGAVLDLRASAARADHAEDQLLLASDHDESVLMAVRPQP